MHNDKETNQLLTNEALRCRLAHEAFIMILEKEISNHLWRKSVAWILIQDRYVAWISHLYEFLKACYAKEMSTHIDEIDEEICKRHGVKKRDAYKFTDSRIDEYGIQAIESTGRHNLDREIVFSKGFGESMRKIRNQYYAHLSSEQIKLDWITRFSEKHYYTAFCCYKGNTLHFANFDKIPKSNIETIKRLREKILSIPDNRE
ncbi:hypothetical protein NPJ88_010620 [Halomonas elongata]|uniref:hypothetical protein n=1 Tax=Halomonas elongata TaxID=2746 RepID=UPI00255B3D0E|nr:hypothetical protein [Halomonas elongata]MDL4862789.1 hypothetical protein [Halomonas elongata]